MNREEVIMNYHYLDEHDLKSLANHLSYIPNKSKMPDIKLFFGNCKSNHTLFIQHLITNEVVNESSVICCPKCDKGKLSKPFDTNQTREVLSGIKRNIRAINTVQEKDKLKTEKRTYATWEDEMDNDHLKATELTAIYNLMIDKLLYPYCDVCGVDTYLACERYKVENLKSEETLLFIK